MMGTIKDAWQRDTRPVCDPQRVCSSELVWVRDTCGDVHLATYHIVNMHWSPIWPRKTLIYPENFDGWQLLVPPTG